ncbi:hypothetical protein DJ568_03995 [Mucilaginibacter hurinus]|uniref:TonB-dependent receptor plug domain-containing protein n=1 Tax=Mucilaginibacter hurinus TaxID=2201324 RepID=A0A367GR49_9SPHI|nr:TonB-dependent receptor plug domain-containing protein [Mucilaginibacter hurinus]RCH55922.1 hypothetical protein DJ568_03995 [Mucilaginibacter hurinus]
MKNNISFFFSRLSLYNGRCYLSLCFLLINYIANAQTDTAATLNQVDIKSSVAPQLQTSTPAQTINQIDFLRTNSFNVADAIRNMAGINIRDYGGIGGLKTVSVRSLGANHTAVLYDGVQINDAQNGQIDLSKFNLNNIQGITLYNAQPDDICMPARSFAAASILSITTVKPNLTQTKPYKIIAGIKGGSFGLYNPNLQWQQRLGKRWSFILNTYAQHANGQYRFKEDKDGSDTLAIRRNSDVRIYQADGGLYWTKSDSNKFSFQVNYYNADRGLPGPNVLYVSYDGQRLYNRDIFLQSAYRFIAKNSLQLLLNSKISQNYLRYVNPNTLNNQGKTDERTTQREVYQSVALSFKLLPQLEVSYAGDFVLSDVEINVFNASPQRFAAYNVMAGNLTFGRLQLQGNLLHTYINESANTGLAAQARSAYTPTLIGKLQPFKAVHLYIRAYYKNIFRPPTLAEQYYFAIAPRPLRPEYVKQYNLGVVYGKNFNGILKYMSLSADAYYNKVKDKLIFLPTRSPETPSVVNLGLVNIRGLDVNIKSKIEPAHDCTVLVSASYTHQRAVNVTNPTDSYYGNQIQYTPLNSAAVNTGLQYKKFGVNYNYTLSSHRYDGFNNNAQSFLPAYAVSDVSFTYNPHLQRKPILAAVELNNIFNKNYSVIQSYPMAGRSVRLTFQITI